MADPAGAVYWDVMLDRHRALRVASLNDLLSTGKHRRQPSEITIALMTRTAIKGKWQYRRPRGKIWREQQARCYDVWERPPASTSGPKDLFGAALYAGQRLLVVQDHGSRYGGDTALCQLLSQRYDLEDFA